MNRVITCLCALLLLPAMISPVAADDQMVSLSIRDGLFFVPVEIDRRVDTRFLLDTGAGRMYVDSTFADSVGLDVVQMYPRPRIFRDFTTYIRRKDRLERLEIADQRLRDVKVSLVRTDTVVFGGGVRPPGVISYPVLKDFFVTIDGPGEMFQLDERKPRFLNRQARAIPFHNYWQLPIVSVSVGGSTKLSMIIDYGSRDSYLIPSAARRLGLAAGRDSLAVLTNMQLLPEVPAEDVPVRILRGKQYRGADRRTNFDGVLGISYLSRHKITIDYSEQVMYLHRE